MIKDILITLIHSIIVAVVPLVAAYAVRWLNAKAEQLKCLTDNEKTQACIYEVAEAVSTAVAYVSQTYVDDIKKSDVFTPENQKAALDQAKSKATSMLSESSLKFIEESYGGVEHYIEAKIESEIQKRRNK